MFKLFFPFSTKNIVFIGHNGTTDANGSELNPFPDMTTAMNSTTDFEITLVLLHDEMPYEFFQNFDFNTNLNIK